MIIFIVTIAFIAGILWGLYLKISIIPFLVLVLVLTRKKLAILFVIFCMISNLYICGLENQFQSKYKDIIGEISIVGTIVSNIQEKEYSCQYKVRVEELRYKGKEQKQCKNTHILLKVKKDKSSNILNYGDKIVLNGEFELAEIQRNYGGFDYREYLKTKNIYGIVTTSQVKLIKANNVNIINIFANKVSQKVKQNIYKILPEKQANLLTGILIGDKSNLSDEIQENFRNSNLSHMLAISGAHVSYIILGFTFILNKVKVGKKESKIIEILFLIFYTVLTGSSPSVQRAVIMAIYILVGKLIYRKPNILVSISFSILILLIQNPYNLLDIGFQLSYGGTIGIVLLNKKLKLKKCKIGIIQKIKEMMVITLAANIIIFPIIMLHYNTISLTFLISNVLASPILGIVIILGFIVVLLSFILNPISMFLAKILQIFLNILIFIADFSSKLPFSKIYVATPSLLQIIIYYSIILISIIKKKTILNKIKKIMIIYLIITIIFPTISIFAGKLKIYFIDVGQGDSTLIVTPNRKSILIDGGGSEKKGSFDIGKNTLLPYLLDRKITKLDLLIVSHFDSDHVRSVC